MHVAPRLIPASLLLSVALVGALPAPSASAATPLPPGWTQFGHSAAHDGYNPSDTGLYATNVGSLRVQWSATTDADAAITGSPVVDGGRLFVQTTAGHLFAFDAATGTRLWRATAGDSGSAAGPALWHGYVITAAPVGKRVLVTAFDQATGHKRWTRHLGGQGWVAMPAISGDSVFLSTGAAVFALSVRNGHLRWQTTLTTDPENAGIWGPVAVSPDGNDLVAASLDGHVFDLATATGAIRWQTKAGGGIYRGGPSIMDGVAYVPEGREGAEGGGFDIVALQLTTGEVLWRGFAGDDVHVVPSAALGMVFVGAIDTGFRALFATTGDERWAVESLPEIWSSAAIANGIVFESTESTFLALNAATGAQLFSAEIGSGFANMSSPIVWNGRVYVGSGDGMVRAFGLP